MPERTDQPPEQHSPRTCTACSGDGGRTINTSHDGVTVETWQYCNGCSGTGTAGGGV
jgi:DnaJ-class molecular chaperone